MARHVCSRPLNSHFVAFVVRCQVLDNNSTLYGPNATLVELSVIILLIYNCLEMCICLEGTLCTLRNNNR